MSIQMVKLLGRELVAEETMAFHFEKPDGFQRKKPKALKLFDAVMGIYEIWLV